MTDQQPPDRDAERREDDPDGERDERPPHPSPAEGGTSESGERPDRPSQAEGERTSDA